MKIIISFEAQSIEEMQSIIYWQVVPQLSDESKGLIQDKDETMIGYYAVTTSAIATKETARP